MKEGFLLKVFRVIVGGILFVLLTILFLISDILWDLGEMGSVKSFSQIGLQAPG